MVRSRAPVSRRLIKDAVIVTLSVLAAIALSRSGLLSEILLIDERSKLLGIFIAGVLFTSLFTSPIGIAMFIALAPSSNIFIMSAIGGLGAVVGDLAIFLLIRYAFQQDVQHVMSLPKYKRFFAIFHRRMFRWVLPFVGALIIASPFPDEIGLGLMGISHMRVRDLMIISFIMNALGIAFVGLLA